ncbi:4Fe-4S dicluster domain-containing protein [Nocardioides sp. GY 10113]|uniref:4Fe-4S dicluster domain-containing protein n=1 Tax=Nocardioides sp. GY 10113 TaxID=2569761 RepID=UPI0010A906F6|nr:4Fe-4S dicluster domain-containing protein [Nocardioides sp. GY 10113]TIC88787.1 4Fe-4S dicluster domain-containing protein [Nocardioides sp. GY 10113]
MPADQTADQTADQPSEQTDRGRELARWVLATGAPEAAVLACVHAADTRVPVGAVCVLLPGCLDSVDVGLPAQLLACGVREVRVTPCPQHPARAAARAAQWARVLDGVTHGSTGRPRRARRSGPTFSLADGRASDRPTVSRRRLLGLGRAAQPPFDLTLDEAGRGLAALAVLRREGRARPLPDATPPAPVPAPPVPERAGGAGSAAPGEPVAERESAVAARLVATGCIACGVCVQACPHDALRLTDLEGSSVLRHRPADCRGEQECVRLCPESALADAGGLSLLDLADASGVVLARVETNACTRCGARHPADEGPLCSPCAYRRANPFGSVVRTGRRSGGQSPG